MGPEAHLGLILQVRKEKSAPTIVSWRGKGDLRRKKKERKTRSERRRHRKARESWEKGGDTVSVNLC